MNTPLPPEDDYAPLLAAYALGEADPATMRQDVGYGPVRFQFGA
jgi:hypothetical protein